MFPDLVRRGFLLPTRLKNSYEGAGTGGRSSGWKASNSGPVGLTTGSLATLRSRSRKGVRDDPYAFSAIDRLVSNTIGTGISPKPLISDQVQREEMQQLWDDWCSEADADGALDFYGLQALACRAVYESGECFVRIRPRRLADGLPVPMQIQVLEPEFVPETRNGTATNGNRIRQGIEFNAIGQRVAYWMHKSHPGERAGAGDFGGLVRVPAEAVLHVYEPTRPGQLRGVPLLAPVLLRLKTLDDFDDAVLYRQEVANLFAGFIKRPDQNASAGAPSWADQSPAGFAPAVGLEPGTMQELMPGEEVEFSSPPDAGNNYPDFMRQQLMAIAAGVGLPYETLTGDLRDVNDRVIRVILNEFRRRIEQRQEAVFIHQLCRPVRNAWLDAAVLSGALALPGYAANPRPWRRTRWVPQGWAYIHPVQDVQADRLAIRAGLTTRSDVAMRRGTDAETIDRVNAEDNARATALDLSYDSDTRVSDDGKSTPKDNQ
ncbi:phage portal protein [Laribacter hongkongensis]|uniref:phage portal protein n=1 Tax=Laribacter hongkongensis TaxID=168471 RepID=UPI001EFEDECA|nr:phage portal protein [Laribacter hongkongensis]MCG9083947.1 phage portal protein [Laribacter hongkongensis]